MKTTFIPPPLKVKKDDQRNSFLRKFDVICATCIEETLNLLPVLFVR